jgi:outer membrane biosynthesis protein TonB
MIPPSSRPPAGVPTSSGNAKYALIALFLIAGIGVTLALRRSPPAPASAPSPVASVAPTPANPQVNDIPPPPPPEEVVEAGPASPRVVYQTINGGCDGRCNGTPPPELEQALAVRANHARHCYNSALAQDPNLKGRVSVAVRIGPSGNVCSASVASNDMGTPTVAECAANVFRTAAGYPAPRGGCVDAKVPLNFIPLGH